MARAHEFAPDRTDISYALTEQLLLLDYVRSAEEVLTNTMKANPSDPLLLVGEGDLKAAESQHAAAVEFYQEALVQQPGSIAALIGLSRANILQGKEDQARTYLQRALAVDPGNSAANGTLGLMELHQGNWDLAITHLRSSWEKDQSNSEVLLGLARAYRRADRSGDALGVLAAVDSGVRNTPAFHLELSQVYSQLHRTQDAKKEQESFRALQANTRGGLRFDKPQSYVF
jgi:tetratricopeptide (TPR) repeat protein